MDSDLDICFYIRYVFIKMKLENKLFVPYDSKITKWFVIILYISKSKVNYKARPIKVTIFSSIDMRMDQPVNIYFAVFFIVHDVYLFEIACEARHLFQSMNTAYAWKEKK